MSWNFKMTWDDFCAEAMLRFKRIDTIMGGLLRDYYHEVEPQRLVTGWTKLMDADRANSPEDKHDEIIKAMDEFIGELEADLKRLGVAISAQEIKRIHVLKGKLGWSDEHYRGELYEVSNKSSSRELNKMEAAVMISRMNEAVER